jgi:flagellum-specific peptidoglycan hydrolase FlgJ
MKKLILITLALLFFTCSGHAQNFKQYKQAEFLTFAYEFAIIVHFKYDIPPAVTMAVCILESGWGQSYAARVRCNYFGYNKGKKIYPSATASFLDFGLLLRTKKRYKPLFKNDLTDVGLFCHGLRACGYNNSEDYPTKLIQIIKSYKLDEL